MYRLECPYTSSERQRSRARSANSPARALSPNDCEKPFDLKKENERKAKIGGKRSDSRRIEGEWEGGAREGGPTFFVFEYPPQNSTRLAELFSNLYAFAFGVLNVNVKGGRGRRKRKCGRGTWDSSSEVSRSSLEYKSSGIFCFSRNSERASKLGLIEIKVSLRRRGKTKAAQVDEGLIRQRIRVEGDVLEALHLKDKQFIKKY